MVIDASALIAFLRKEKGHEKVARTLTQRECVLSAVTRTELLGKLVGSGSYTETEVYEALVPLCDALDFVAFEFLQSDLEAFCYARRI
ncbi:PIN domain-containing protein, partial [Allomeiothermus silvanus]|uniref:PIN domain-containing protein n=1 Tax=Allomeiothermus silvanus TaxID=52022 RepID=UPI0023F3C042